MKICGLVAAVVFSGGGAFAEDIVIGSGTGRSPTVLLRDGFGGAFYDTGSFDAFASGFTGGVTVASGDVNGDGLADIIAGAGAGGGPQVKIFSGADHSLLRSFFAFDPAFAGGVYVAVGDVDGDGFADVVTGAGAGGAPQVKVFSGASGEVIRSFLAFDSGFIGGVRVAAGDIDGDGKADIVAGSGSGAAHVKVFDGVTSVEKASFLPFGAFTGGVFVSAGNLDGSGGGEIVAAQDGGGTVSVFTGAGSLVQSFTPYGDTFAGGVRVAVGDVNGDGQLDIITGPGAETTQVRAYNGSTLAQQGSFTPLSGFTGGVFVAGRVSGISRAVAPVINPPTGAYEDFVPLFITTLTPGATIHYTLNGTTPDLNSPVFQFPFFVDDPTLVVKAIAHVSGHADSSVSTAILTIVSSSTSMGGAPEILVDARSRITTRKKSITIKGDAQGDHGVARVEYRISGSRGWKRASGTENWSAKISLRARTTTVEFRAVGGDGLVSDTEKVTIKRSNLKAPAR